MGETARIRFGTFDFAPDTGILRREGITVRLQSQPAQVLGLLLAHPGEVVTRETLRQAIWGNGTFVDFDRGLNFCIAQIRSALGDSAESPRFVRTLPKRGYQFIAPVIPAADPGGAPLPSVLGSSSSEPRALASSTRYRILIVATVVLAAAILWWHPWAPVRSPIRVAVARFDNETGSPELDRFADGLTDSVVAELTAAAGPGYGVVGNAAILRRPRSQRDLGTIGTSLSVGYVILGQVQRNSSQVRVLAHLIRLPEQTHVDVARFDITVDDALRVQADLAQRIAARFSRRLSSSQPAVSD